MVAVVNDTFKDILCDFFRRFKMFNLPETEDDFLELSKEDEPSM